MDKQKLFDNFIPSTTKQYDEFSDCAVLAYSQLSEKYLLYFTVRYVAIKTCKYLKVVITNDKPIYKKVQQSNGNDLYIACYYIELPFTLNVISKVLSFDVDDCKLESIEELISVFDYFQPINISYYYEKIFSQISKHLGDPEIDITSIVNRFCQCTKHLFPNMSAIYKGYYGTDEKHDYYPNMPNSITISPHSFALSKLAEEVEMKVNGRKFRFSGSMDNGNMNIYNVEVTSLYGYTKLYVFNIENSDVIEKEEINGIIRFYTGANLINSTNTFFVLC